MLTIVTYRKIHYGPNVQETTIRGLVSADELRWFWISWKNENISYGRGRERGRNIIGWYNDLTPSHVDLMMINSYGYNSGFWIIPSVYYITGVFTKFISHFIFFFLKPLSSLAGIVQAGLIIIRPCPAKLCHSGFYARQQELL